MLLTPKRRKFRKQFIKPLKWKSSRWSTISFGDYWIKAITSWYVSNRQLEAVRKVIVRHTRKVGKLWLRVFPDRPFTKKWLEMPMGKGKWDVDIYKAAIRKWKILIEVTWLEQDQAEDILLRASKKLPIKTRVVFKWEIR